MSKLGTTNQWSSSLICDTVPVQSINHNGPSSYPEVQWLLGVAHNYWRSFGRSQLWKKSSLLQTDHYNNKQSLMESGKVSRLSDKQKNYWEEEETYLVCRAANSYHDSQSFWLSLNYKTLKYSLKEMEHIRDSSLGRVLVVVVVMVVVWRGKSESSDVMPSQTLTVVKVGPQWGCWGDCVVVSGGGSSVSLFAIGAHHPWACSTEILPSGGLPPLMGPGHQHHWHHQHHQRNQQIATLTGNTFIYTIN